MLSRNLTMFFYLKKRSNYKSGKLPIYIRITVEGERMEISTKRECEPEKWNSQTGRKNGLMSTYWNFKPYSFWILLSAASICLSEVVLVIVISSKNLPAFPVIRLMTISKLDIFIDRLFNYQLKLQKNITDKKSW